MFILYHGKDVESGLTKIKEYTNEEEMNRDIISYADWEMGRPIHYIRFWYDKAYRVIDYGSWSDFLFIERA